MKTDINLSTEIDQNRSSQSYHHIKPSRVLRRKKRDFNRLVKPHIEPEDTFQELNSEDSVNLSPNLMSNGTLNAFCTRNASQDTVSLKELTDHDLNSKSDFNLP